MYEKQVLSIDEMYDVLLRINLENNHVPENWPYKRLSQEFHGFTENACDIFLRGCEEFHLRKTKKRIKSILSIDIFKIPISLSSLSGRTH